MASQNTWWKSSYTKMVLSRVLTILEHSKCCQQKMAEEAKSSGSEVSELGVPLDIGDLICVVFLYHSPYVIGWIS